MLPQETRSDSIRIFSGLVVMPCIQLRQRQPPPQLKTLFKKRMRRRES
jgi:hypothetical protein